MGNGFSKWHLLTAAIGGVALGALLLAFIVYPPASGWGSTFNWGDVATWVSAFVTMVAVVVAALAIWGDNRRQHAAQAAEWSRADAARARKTAILAKTFHNELHRGFVEVHALRMCLVTLSPATVADFRSTFASPSDREFFAMMIRFSNELDGFSEMVAIAILNAIGIWQVAPILSKGIVPGMSDAFLVARKDDFDAQCKEIIEVFQQLQRDLEPYFIQLPGIRMMTMDELRAHNAARCKAVGTVA